MPLIHKATKGFKPRIGKQCLQIIKKKINSTEKKDKKYNQEFFRRRNKYGQYIHGEVQGHFQVESGQSSFTDTVIENIPMAVAYFSESIRNSDEQSPSPSIATSLRWIYRIRET